MKGFFDYGDGITKGKGIDAVENSREGYSQLLALFGGIENLPSSIMKADKGRPTDKTDRPVAERGLYEKKVNGEYLSKQNGIPETLKRAYHVSGSGCGSGALSTFPQNIGRSVVLLYSDPGQVVFDPFAGHNSRLELTVRAGRHYVGCDLSAEFMAFNKKRAKELRTEFPEVRIKLHHVDSRKVPVEDCSADCTLTSPPYWDIEYYGDEEEQLGKSSTYKEFLNGLQEVMAENFRVLRPGSYACWFVNDFRRKGKLHLYHIDTIKRMQRVGFKPHDIMISDLGRGIRDCFPNQIIKQRILPKRHEYGLVFRKPLENES